MQLNEPPFVPDTFNFPSLDKHIFTCSCEYHKIGCGVITKQVFVPKHAFGYSFTLEVPFITCDKYKYTAYGIEFERSIPGDSVRKWIGKKLSSKVINTALDGVSSDEITQEILSEMKSFVGDILTPKLHLDILKKVYDKNCKEACRARKPRPKRKTDG